MRKEVKELRKENKRLREVNSLLVKENEELRRRLNLRSHNSSKPPSSDPLWERAQRPVKAKSKNRKRGGQLGHKGSNLKKFTQIDFLKEHTYDTCPYCQSNKLLLKGIKTRQVLDIPRPKMEVTEHRFYEYQCLNCCATILNDKIQDYKQSVQYGPNIKSFVNYLNVYQLLPYKRLVAMIKDLFGHKISQGSISNFNSELSTKLKGFIAELKNYFIQPDKVFHSDETGCMVGKQNYWLHVYCDQNKTLLQGHRSRGTKAMNEIGILDKAQGTVVHDRYMSYPSYKEVGHALCNAHILRDLKGVEENAKCKWATQIKSILLKAKSYKTNDKLSSKRKARLQKEYENILRSQRKYYQTKEEELKLQHPKKRPKRSTDHNLYIALWKYKHEILKFMYHKEIPFDNNQAERDLRMFKVKMKISSLFQSPYWLEVNANIRSFISTIVKNEGNVLESIQQVYNDEMFAKNMAV